MPTWPTKLYVDKQQPAFSSALVAWGLAHLLHDLLAQLDLEAPVTLSNQGTCFCIATSASFDISEVPYVRLLRQIRTAKQRTGLADDAYDYEQFRQRERDYFTALENLRKEGTSPAQLPQSSDRRKQIEELKPRPEWQIITMVNQMGALSAYNEVAGLWQNCTAIFPELLQIVIEAFAISPNRLEEAQKQWKLLQNQHELSGKMEVTASQTVNPDQGKGANRPKADVLTIHNLDSFWLLEALKFVGCFEAAAHYVVRGSKDRKTYVALPCELELSTHRKIFDEFRTQLWPATAVKLDVLATLRYCHVFIGKWEDAQGTANFRPCPDDYISGFATAYYKDLGNAVATFNLAQCALPQWAPGRLDDVSTARMLKEALEEYINILSQLDERFGEEESMLRSFREFLSSRDPAMRAFFEFTSSYAAYLMQRLIRHPQLQTRQLTTKNLEVIVMSTDTIRPEKPMSPIVQNPGFQHIAEAIRRSTVIPQRLKSKGERTYEIRYGLADELRRHARYPGKFIQALSDFIQSYNQENVRIYEREHRQLRKDVTADDLEQVIALMDDYDATTVAHLLIAFGYARDLKDRQDLPTPTRDTDNTAEPSTEIQ
jgi:hypothetical protein